MKQQYDYDRLSAQVKSMLLPCAHCGCRPYVDNELLTDGNGYYQTLVAVGCKGCDVVMTQLGALKEIDEKHYDKALYDTLLMISTKWNSRFLNVADLDNWISVQDRLPKENEKVLISYRKDIFIAVYNDNNWHYFNENGIEVTGKMKMDWMELDWFNFVTHWMPLPELPEHVDERIV